MERSVVMLDLECNIRGDLECSDLLCSSWFETQGGAAGQSSLYLVSEDSLCFSHLYCHVNLASC